MSKPAPQTLPHAVLIGLDSLQGLQAARILAKHRIPVIGLASDQKHYGCRTNVCEEIIFTDTKSDSLVETLLALGGRLPRKAVLLPCDDANVLLVSRHRKRLASSFHIVLPAAETVELLLDKVLFYRYAQQQGLPIPATRFLSSRSDAEQAAQELTFPIILKPHNSATPEWEANCLLSAFKIQNESELFDHFDRYRDWTSTLIAQECILGPDTNHYACNGYFNADSHPLLTCTTRKLRQWPPDTGIGCLGEECSNPIVEDEMVRLFKGLDYRGLAYLEMKRDDRSGKYFIIEPNIGRPTGRSATCEAAGLELLYTMYAEATGLPLPAEQTVKYPGIKWISLRHDLQSSVYRWLRGDLTLGQWWQSIRGRKVYALLCLKDPKPFLSDWARTIGVLFSKQEIKKRSYANPKDSPKKEVRNA